MAEKKKNIYEKILAIMQNVTRLQKDDEVSYKSTRYKALSEEKVTTIMRQQLIEQRLVVYPIQQISSRAGTITHVDVVYRMVNVDNPEEYIEIASCGDGADTQDKGSGKAMTYAFKYMWLRSFALPTGEDPDKVSSAELDEKERKEREAKERAAQKIGAVKAKALSSLLEEKGIDAAFVCGLYKVKKLEDLTERHHLNIHEHLADILEKQNATQEEGA